MWRPCGPAYLLWRPAIGPAATRSNFSPSVYNEAVAKRMVAYLSGHLLPETYGLAAVDNAGDGEHTDLTWAEGSVLYHASDYHHALGALKMAVSMRQNP